MDDQQRHVVRSLTALADHLLLNGQLDAAQLAADAALLQEARYTGTHDPTRRDGAP